MFSPPKRAEINERTMKLIVGVVAISLAALTSAFAHSRITSISASYYEGGVPRNIFVGFLFAIAAFLLAYNGKSSVEMAMSKLASLAALGVALFPCECVDHHPAIPHVHGISTTVMFSVLAYFCYTFFQRAHSKAPIQAQARAGIYGLCGIGIIVSVCGLLMDHFTGGSLSARFPRFTFYGEETGLVSFGISWLTASRVLPFITREDERMSLISDHVPP